MPGLLRDLVALYQHVQDPDKAKRDQAMQFFTANPDAYQKLIDSHMADDPKALQQVFGQNARWGANSNSASNMVNVIQSAPLSEAEKANRLEDVEQTNPNDIADATKKLPQMRAFNGMSNGTFQNMVPQMSAAIQNNAPANNPSPAIPGYNPTPTPQVANPPRLLSQDQQDMLAAKRTGETSLTKAKGAADIKLLGAEADSAVANAANNRAMLPKIQAEGSSAARANALSLASDKAVDMYYQSHPDARKRKISDIMDDPTVDPDVRSSFLNSTKYGDVAKADITRAYEDRRLALEKRGQDISLQEREQWLPKLQQAQALDAYAKNGFQGPIKGYTDIFTGNGQTPEAQAAASIMQTGSPQLKRQSVGQYNMMYSKLQSMLASKTPPSRDNIDNQIMLLNTRAKELQAMGINTPEVKYDLTPAEHKGLGQNISGFVLPQSMQPRSLQTLDGGQVTPPSYDPKADPGLVKNNQQKGPVNPDDYVKEIQSGRADETATLADPRISPYLKSQITQRLHPTTRKK